MGMEQINQTTVTETLNHKISGQIQLQKKNIKEEEERPSSLSLSPSNKSNEPHKKDTPVWMISSLYEFLLSYKFKIQRKKKK